MSHDAFLRAIRQSPGDDAPRLVFADWLDDHGDHARAEFIRLQCGSVRSTEREADLLREHVAAWLGPLRPLVTAWTFRRGFLTDLHTHARDAVAVDEYLPALPFRPRVTVDLDGFEPSPAVLALWPEHAFEDGIVFPLGERDGFALLAAVHPRSEIVFTKLDCFNRPARLFHASGPQLVQAFRRHFGGEADLLAQMYASEPNHWFVLCLDDVALDLSQPDVPVRRGTIHFTMPIPDPLPTKLFRLVADCSRGMKGVRCGYTLTAVAEPDIFMTAYPLDALRDIRIEYRGASEMVGVGADAGGGA